MSKTAQRKKTAASLGRELGARLARGLGRIKKPMFNRLVAGERPRQYGGIHYRAAVAAYAHTMGLLREEKSKQSFVRNVTGG